MVEGWASEMIEPERVGMLRVQGRDQGKRIVG